MVIAPKIQLMHVEYVDSLLLSVVICCLYPRLFPTSIVGWPICRSGPFLLGWVSHAQGSPNVRLLKSIKYLPKV